MPPVTGQQLDRLPPAQPSSLQLLAILSHFQQKKGKDAHSREGVAPDADACSGVEEPQEGVAEDVHEHGEAVDGLCATHERVSVALKAQEERMSPSCP